MIGWSCITHMDLHQYTIVGSILNKLCARSSSMWRNLLIFTAHCCICFNFIQVASLWLSRSKPHEWAKWCFRETITGIISDLCETKRASRCFGAEQVLFSYRCLRISKVITRLVACVAQTRVPRALYEFCTQYNVGPADCKTNKGQRC